MAKSGVVWILGIEFIENVFIKWNENFSMNKKLRSIARNRCFNWIWNLIFRQRASMTFSKDNHIVHLYSQTKVVIIENGLFQNQYKVIRYLRKRIAIFDLLQVHFLKQYLVYFKCQLNTVNWITFIPDLSSHLLMCDEKSCSSLKCIPVLECERKLQSINSKANEIYVMDFLTTADLFAWMHKVYGNGTQFRFEMTANVQSSEQIQFALEF